MGGARIDALKEVVCCSWEHSEPGCILGRDTLRVQVGAEDCVRLAAPRLAKAQDRRMTASECVRDGGGHRGAVGFSLACAGREHSVKRESPGSWLGG